MSLSINFEPHSWYMGFAIEQRQTNALRGNPAHQEYVTKYDYYAVTADGMTGYLVEREDLTLKGIKSQIKAFRNNYYQKN